MVRISVCGLHELDDDHRSSIAAANAELEDTRVTALAVFVAWRKHIKNFCNHRNVAHFGDRQAALGEAATRTQSTDAEKLREVLRELLR